MTLDVLKCRWRLQYSLHDLSDEVLEKAVELVFDGVCVRRGAVRPNLCSTGFVFDGVVW